METRVDDTGNVDVAKTNGALGTRRFLCLLHNSRHRNLYILPPHIRLHLHSLWINDHSMRIQCMLDEAGRRLELAIALGSRTVIKEVHLFHVFFFSRHSQLKQKKMDQEWLDIHHTFLGTNYRQRDPVSALARARNCAHPEARWLCSLIPEGVDTDLDIQICLRDVAAWRGDMLAHYYYGVLAQDDDHIRLAAQLGCCARAQGHLAGSLTDECTRMMFAKEAVNTGCDPQGQYHRGRLGHQYGQREFDIFIAAQNGWVEAQLDAFDLTSIPRRECLRVGMMAFRLLPCKVMKAVRSCLYMNGEAEIVVSAIRKYYKEAYPKMLSGTADACWKFVGVFAAKKECDAWTIVAHRIEAAGLYPMCKDVRMMIAKIIWETRI